MSSFTTITSVLQEPVFSVNDAVLDWAILRGAERPFSRLASLTDVLCFFSIVEATAIYDNLWISPKDESALSALRPLLDRHIIQSSSHIPDSLVDPQAKASFVNVAEMLRHGEMARLSEVAATADEASEVTYARYDFATGSHIDAVLDPVLSAYVPLVKQQVTRSAVHRLSTALSDTFRRELEELAADDAPIPLYIPPISAVALDRSAHPSDVIDEILAIRDEFAGFRRKYANYQMIIQNPGSHTVREIAEALRDGLHEVEQSIRDLKLPRTTSRLMFEMLDVTVANSSSGLSISKPLGSIARGLVTSLQSRIIRGRANCLFDLWKAAANIKGYDRLLLRHFDLEATALSADVDQARMLGLWIEQKAGVKRPTV